ncbi:unnamed protein product [Lactuca saligna]|uniref:At2g35280-like TPR domain-containing protein n=1 Tax=Lactuca saligna TaxID=75948 RepID=A0AA35ZFM7_LACSI|nr:unnamed protein product [Lactuca saligna]
MRNPNLLFRDGLMKLFFLEADREGKSMLEEASALGHLDSTFVLELMLMVEGKHWKQEALDMLNNAYRRTKGLQLLDAYSAWAVPDNGECTGVVDSAKELLWTVDIVHILTTKNITFRYEEPNDYVKGAFAVGHEEDDDRQRYCMVCRWYVEYGRFCMFLKNIDG